MVGGVVTTGKVALSARRVARAVVRTSANALRAVKGELPAALAAEDDTLRGFATDTGGATDRSAILTLTSRGATTAGVEGLSGVNALVWRRRGRKSAKRMGKKVERERTATRTGHDARELLGVGEVLSDGSAEGRRAEDGAGGLLAGAKSARSDDLALLSASGLRGGEDADACREGRKRSVSMEKGEGMEKKEGKEKETDQT